VAGVTGPHKSLCTSSSRSLAQKLDYWGKELLHTVEARQASHHLLGTEPLQGLEVKVPEALVPLPRLIVPTSSEAQGLCYLHIKGVQSTCASSYLDKKAMMAIPNPHDSILDLNTRVVLYQLSQADESSSTQGCSRLW